MTHQVNDFSGFEPVGQVTVQDRKRVSLARAHIAVGHQYSVWQRADGAMLLLPIAPVPATDDQPQPTD